MNKFLVQLLIMFLIVVTQHTRNYNLRDIFVLSLIFYMNISANRNFDKAVYDSVVVSLIYIGLVLFLKRYIYQTEGFKSGGYKNKKYQKSQKKKKIKKTK